MGAECTAALKVLSQTQIKELNVDGGPLPIDQLTGTTPTIDFLGKRLGGASAVIISACIGGNAHLKQLNLGSNHITNDGKDMFAMIKLAETLPQSSIATLDLNNIALCGLNRRGEGTFTVEGLTPLCEAFTKMPSLTSVSLDNNVLCGVMTNVASSGRQCGTFTLEGLTPLCEALLKMPSLTFVSLAGNTITNNGKDMSAVLKLVEVLPQSSINSLNLDGNQLCGLDDYGHGSRGTFTLEGLTPLCEAFTKMPSLTSVSLAKNYIAVGTERGVLKLAEVLPKTSINSLNVDGHPLPIDQLKGTTPTDSIDFSRKDLGVASAVIIASCICDNEHLKQLNLYYNKMGAEGTAALAKGLPGSKIETLNLANNDISNQGKDMSAVIKLAEALPHTSITTLNLAGNTITNNGKNYLTGNTTNDGKDMSALIKLAEVLPKTSINSLNLNDTNITKSGKDMSAVIKLAEVLPQTSIASLNLDGSALYPHSLKMPVTKLLGDSFTEGAKVRMPTLIANVEREVTVFKEADDEGNVLVTSVDPTGFTKLVEAFTKMPSLTSVSLANNEITNKGKDMSLMLKP